jgi:AcrR family transcriptional regulator
MPIEERRRAILTAVIPLLVEKGAAVTTAEMAQAADIAEGTIFRAFPDKSALICAALETTIDPQPVVAAIRRIDGEAPLRQQLMSAARVLVDHFTQVVALAELLRSTSASIGQPMGDGRRMIGESSAAIAAALTVLLRRHSRDLRVAPSKAIAALRGLVFASGHPLVPAAERLTVEEAVEILLTGVVRKDRD